MDAMDAVHDTGGTAPGQGSKTKSLEEEGLGSGNAPVGERSYRIAPLKDAHTLAHTPQGNAVRDGPICMLMYVNNCRCKHFCLHIPRKHCTFMVQSGCQHDLLGQHPKSLMAKVGPIAWREKDWGRGKEASKTSWILSQAASWCRGIGLGPRGPAHPRAAWRGGQRHCGAQGRAGHLPGPDGAVHALAAAQLQHHVLEHPDRRRGRPGLLVAFLLGPLYEKPAQ